MEAKELDHLEIDVYSPLRFKGLRVVKVGEMDWGSFSVGFSWNGRDYIADSERFGASYSLERAANSIILRYHMEPNDQFSAFMGPENMAQIKKIFDAGPDNPVISTPIALLPSGSIDAPTPDMLESSA